MPEQTMWFYLVFLSQVLLISFYFPRRILGRVKYMVENYPPSDYPRLYPVPISVVEKAQRYYRNMNRIALLVGFLLLATLIYSPTAQRLKWDFVLTFHIALQFSPLLIAATSGFVYFNLKRKADSRSTRRAELRRR